MDVSVLTYICLGSYVYMSWALRIYVSALTYICLGLPQFLQDCGVVGHFELVYFVGDGFWGVVGREGSAELGNDLACVADGSDVVDGDTGLCFAGSLHGFVDVMSPHAFSSVLGQEGRVDVHDAAGIEVEEVVGHHGEEAGEDDEMDVVGTQQGQHDVRILQVGLRHHTGGNAQPLCTRGC